jgi:hypothetical protein
LQIDAGGGAAVSTRPFKAKLRDGEKFELCEALVKVGEYVKL